MTPALFLTSAEVAASMGVTTTTVSGWVRQGKLRPMRTPVGRLLFRPEDVDAFTSARARSSVSRVIVDRLAREMDEQQNGQGVT